ncbi:MAG: SH3 domain-containing protein [Pseudanabaenaceae cyanobacterium]|jgi:hypothetical protein
MRFPEIAKSGTSIAFSLGIVIALGAAVWNYIVIPYRTQPKRPTFANDLKIPPSPTPLAFKPNPNKFKAPPPSPKPTAKPTLEAKYEGRVNASIGLVLRSEPKQSAEPRGGVDYNAKVAVIKETPDKEWVFIRNGESKEEGWVRMGNISRSGEANNNIAGAPASGM